MSFTKKSRLDIVSFLRILYRYRIAAIRDVAYRYPLTLLDSIIYNYRALPSLQNLLIELFSSDDNILVIFLDSCRYDLFKSYAHTYFEGIIRPVKSKGAYLPDWVPKLLHAISKNYKVRIFRALNRIPPHNLSFKDFLNSLCNIELIEVEPRGRDLAQLVTLPSIVNKVVIEQGILPKTLIWYMQPHFPWLLCKDISRRFILPFMLYEYIPPTYISKLIDVRIEEVVRCYIRNLLLVLREVHELLKELNSVYSIFKDFRVVITSDHGVFLGEYKLLFHPPSYRLHQIILVPWMEVHNVK